MNKYSFFSIQQGGTEIPYRLSLITYPVFWSNARMLYFLLFPALDSATALGPQPKRRLLDKLTVLRTQATPFENNVHGLSRRADPKIAARSNAKTDCLIEADIQKKAWAAI